MSVNRIPMYHATKAVAQVQLAATANTNYDGTTGTYSAAIVTAGANGLAVTRIDVVAIGTSAAALVRLFITDLSNSRMVAEIAISAVTGSATVASATGSWTPGNDGLILPSGWSIKASTTVAQLTNVFVYYGTY